MFNVEKANLKIILPKRIKNTAMQFDVKSNVAILNKTKSHCHLEFFNSNLLVQTQKYLIKEFKCRKTAGLVGVKCTSCD